jgi:hypothetical protein
MSNPGSVPDQPAEPQPREIGDDEYLSQYGSRQGGKPLFWSRPRPTDTDGLSATIGRLTPAEARKPVRMIGAATRDDGVRYARVGDLRAKGFEVTHTPSKRNKDHTSISCAGEWDATMEGTFNESWSDPLWHEESGGADHE